MRAAVGELKFKYTPLPPACYKLIKSVTATVPLWGCQVIVRSELIKTSESTRGHGFDILLVLWAKYKQNRPLLSAFKALPANYANCFP